MVRQDIKDLLFEKRKTIKQMRQVDTEIKMIQDKCEHKNTRITDYNYYNAVTCDDCLKDLGEECPEDKGHTHDFDYEYNGNLYHQPCKKCGKIWEDCK